MSERMPIIIDVDTGIDDALALALAARTPGIDLLAVTTLSGNIDCDLATRNSLDVMHLLGAGSVPVHRGATRPLAQAPVFAADIHGNNGLGGATIPTSPHGVGPDRGPAAIIRHVLARPGAITLVCTGPLTNLAIALNVAPEIGRMLKRLVIMGGAFREPGNVRPWAEFNFWADPEAAAQVFAADLPPTTVIGLDVTHQTILSKAAWEEIGAIASPEADLVAKITRRTYVERGRDRFFLHDPLAFGVAIDATLVGCERGAVTIDLDGDERARSRFTPGAGDVEVAFTVDAPRFLRMFEGALGIARG
jgi:purine nucleosidase